MDELIKRFEELEKQMINIKKEFLNAYITIAQKKVLDNIKTKTTRRTGNLESSVIIKLGSGGGYAVTKSPIGRAPHAHLVEDEHTIKRGGAIVGYSKGRHMYRDALISMESDIDKLLREVEEEIVRGLVG